MYDQPPAPAPQPPPDPADDEPRPASIALTTEGILSALNDGDIDEDHGTIQWSSNYTFLLTIRHEDLAIPAVYKPRSGERPLWDFPDGTLCNRERAAYLTSEALGWQLVPPTVLRPGPHGVGSVQFFIDHDPNYHYFEFDESMLPQLMLLSGFDVLVNNADRKGGHCIVDAQNHLWGIDHGITFHSMHKLRTVVWDFAGESIPQKLVGDIEGLCNQIETQSSTYRQEMERLLSPREMQSFRKRIDRTLLTEKYPQPGPGPNYPWPPV